MLFGVIFLLVVDLIRWLCSVNGLICSGLNVVVRLVDFMGWMKGWVW